MTDWQNEKTKYLCIHCKEGFNHIPLRKNNECQRGYYHTFIKRSSIISDEKRESLAKAFLLGQSIRSKFEVKNDVR